MGWLAIRARGFPGAQGRAGPSRSELVGLRVGGVRPLDVATDLIHAECADPAVQNPRAARSNARLR
jgi:hypothetical protein